MDNTVSIVGVTFTRIEGMENGSDTITFTASDGRTFSMFHSQNCCEHVRLTEVIGDVDDLIDAPIVSYECVENSNGDPAPEYPDSWTWTFYKFQSTKGHVTLRWLGESNGYYSERVDFKLDGRGPDWKRPDVR